jgi:hypothetical protein
MVKRRGGAQHLAKENRSWGYDRLAGVLVHLGYVISDQTVGNILKRRGLLPTPERKKTTTWKEFIRTPMDVLWAMDFFTTEVWTMGRLVRYYVLFFIHLAARQVHIAGATPHPEASFREEEVNRALEQSWIWLEAHVAETDAQALDEFLPKFHQASQYIADMRERWNPKDQPLPKLPLPLPASAYGSTPSRSANEALVGSPRRVTEQITFLQDAGARNLM